ncbi:MAG: hypothetical protein KGQ56_00850 [Acidobacteria bacterium]|nr:hypothetical protein [Acidobacteriota bacterium]NDC47591.1 hypothetical protein [Micrococcales bacterium]
MDDATKELLINAFLVLHFIGIASLLAGFLTSMREIRTGMKINAGVLHGVYLMLISGLTMSYLAIKPSDLNVLVISIKSIVLTVIFFLAFTNRKKEVPPKWVVPVIALLTIFNIVIAVFGGPVSE